MHIKHLTSVPMNVGLT